MKSIREETPLPRARRFTCVLQGLNFRHVLDPAHNRRQSSKASGGIRTTVPHLTPAGICLAGWHLARHGLAWMTSPESGRLAAYYAAVLIWLTTTAMHIPDGYLSPATSLVMFLLVLPFWIRGLRKVRRSMDARSVPLIALLSAFSFVIMMLNVPLPGGTTGHAVGASLAAILLGPEVAAVSVSVALIIQAFFFGDGGILALGANCFNMAVVGSYVAFAIYRLVSGTAPVGSARRLVGAGLGGWSGLTVSALFAGIEFGVQPLLFHAADGTPLYAPYPLSISVPAMVLPHALVASIVEAVLTVLVIACLQRSNAGVLEIIEGSSMSETSRARGRLRALWMVLGILVIISPLGLLAPGTAWGEWGTTELERLGLPAIPQGLQKLAGLWGAPLAGYRLPVLGNASLGYVVSAILGALVTAILVWLFVSLATGSAPRPKSERQPRAGRETLPPGSLRP